MRSGDGAGDGSAKATIVFSRSDQAPCASDRCARSDSRDRNARMNREAVELWSDAIGSAASVIRYGHWGRPVLVFPTSRGRAVDFENFGMVGAVADLIDAGRLKLYCVDSYDASSWFDQGIPLEE